MAGRYVRSGGGDQVGADEDRALDVGEAGLGDPGLQLRPRRHVGERLREVGVGGAVGEQRPDPGDDLAEVDAVPPAQDPVVGFGCVDEA